MNAPVTPRATLHPMILVAAIAVTLFSAAGIAAIMGWIPSTKSDEQAQAATKAVAVAPAAQVPAPVAQVPAPVAQVPAPVAQAPTPVANVVPPKPVHQTPAPQPRTARAETPAPKPMASADPAPAPTAPPPPAVQPAPAPSRVICYDCGTIESVRQVASPGEGTGFGAIAGAIGGGVLGHQVGSGRGRDVGTVVGAIGGAIAGHQVEKHARTSSSFEIDVRMDDGSLKTFTQDTAPAWRIGDRVHTHNNVLRSAS